MQFFPIPKSRDSNNDNNNITKGRPLGVQLDHDNNTPRLCLTARSLNMPLFKGFFGVLKPSCIQFNSIQLLQLFSACPSRSTSLVYLAQGCLARSICIKHSTESTSVFGRHLISMNNPLRKEEGSRTYSLFRSDWGFHILSRHMIPPSGLLKRSKITPTFKE
jgi:hypothetical protein